MQAGTRNTRKWVIEFPKKAVRLTDPLTGTTGSRDMRRQVHLQFDSKEAAVAYAKANDIPFQVLEKPKRIRTGRSYADNFAFDRKLPWTH